MIENSRSHGTVSSLKCQVAAISVQAEPLLTRLFFLGSSSAIASSTRVFHALVAMRNERVIRMLGSLNARRERDATELTRLVFMEWAREFNILPPALVSSSSEGGNPEAENSQGENSEAENSEGENSEDENAEGENSEGENAEGRELHDAMFVAIELQILYGHPTR